MAKKQVPENISAKIAKELEVLFPDWCQVIAVSVDPKIARAVGKYIAGAERAHVEAANSTLHFGDPGGDTRAWGNGYIQPLFFILSF